MITSLLEPRSVAIIGASNDPQRIGGRPLRYYKEACFEGRLYPVNPFRKEVQGIKALADIRELPSLVDLAILALPAAKVVAALHDCVSAGVKSAIVFSSGFAELGELGASMQAEITQLAAASKMAVLGPNCLGVVNGHVNHTGTFGSFLDSGPATAGPVAVISQSGAFGSYLFSKLRSSGVEVGLWVATGNEAGVTIADAVAFAATHEGTQTILIYAESLRAGGELLNAVETARRNGKAVAILKVGRTETGQAAAASHTSALASNDRSAAALFRAVGVEWLSTMEEMMDFAYVTSRFHGDIGKRLGIYTVSGGAGILMADAAEEYQLEIPVLAEDVQQEIMRDNPYAVACNPIDVTAQAFNDPELVRKSLSTILRSNSFDTLTVFLMGWLESPVMGPPIREALERLAKESMPPIALIAEVSKETKEWLDGLGYFVFSDPSRGVRALASLVSASRALIDSTDSAIAPIRRPLLESRSYNEIEAKAWLSELGLPVMEDKVCTLKSDALEVACLHPEKPFALKLLSPDVAHKSDIGGVKLNVTGPKSIGDAWDTMMAQVSAEAPDAKIDGALLTPMVEDGVDLIVGIKNEPGFGPILMLGLGGIFAEIFEDVTFTSCPASPSKIKSLLLGLKGSPLLCGARGRAPVDIDAAAVVISRLSSAAASAKDFIDIEINPLRVSPKNVIVLDGLIHPKLDREAVWCWDDFCPGTTIGTVAGVLNETGAILIAKSTTAQVSSNVGCGLVVAELMRAYTTAMPSRTEGNIHAGMDITWGVRPPIGVAVTTTISCIAKEIKRSRLWVTFMANMTTELGESVVSADLKMIWRK